MRTIVIIKKCSACNKENPHKTESKVCISCEPKDPHITELIIGSCARCPYKQLERTNLFFNRYICSVLKEHGKSCDVHKNVLYSYKYKEIPSFCPIKGETRIFEWVYIDPNDRIKALTEEIEETVKLALKPDK